MAKSTLSQKSKDNIIQYGSMVYYGYLGIDFFTRKTGLSSVTVQDQIVDKLKLHPNKDILDDIRIKQPDGKVVKVKLGAVDANGSRKVTFLDASGNPIAGGYPENLGGIKPLAQYTDEEVLQILASKDLVMETASNGDTSFGVKLADSLGKPFQIGGVEEVAGVKKPKLGLYNLHIANLGTMLKDTQDGMQNMLVAMPTGSGKSYTQALWMCVLYAANVNYIVNAPGNLTGQLAGDFRNLLPKVITDQIIEMQQTSIKKEKDPTTGEVKEVKSCRDPDIFQGLLDDPSKPQRAKFIAGGWAEFLDNRFSYLGGIKAEEFANTFISYDEAHKIADSGTEFAKLDFLKTKFGKTMLLTATPNMPMYESCGGKATIELTAKVKVENNTAVPSQFATHLTETIQARNAKLDKNFVIKAKNDAISGVFNYVQGNEGQDISSNTQDALLGKVLKKDPSAKTFYKIPDHVADPKKEADEYIRHNVAVPLGRKSLFLTGSYEQMVSNYLFLESLLECEDINNFNLKIYSKLEACNYENRAERMYNNYIRGEDPDEAGIPEHEKKNRLEAISKQHFMLRGLKSLFKGAIGHEGDIFNNDKKIRQQILEKSIEQAVENIQNPEVKEAAKQKIADFIKNMNPKAMLMHDTKKLIVDYIFASLANLRPEEYGNMRSYETKDLQKRVHLALQNVNGLTPAKLEEFLSNKFDYNPKTNRSGLGKQEADILKSIATELIGKFSNLSPDNDQFERMIKGFWMDIGMYGYYRTKDHHIVDNPAFTSENLNLLAEQNVIRCLAGGRGFEDAPSMNDKFDKSRSFRKLEQKSLDKIGDTLVNDELFDDFKPKFEKSIIDSAKEVFSGSLSKFLPQLSSGKMSESEQRDIFSKKRDEFEKANRPSGGIWGGNAWEEYNKKIKIEEKYINKWVLLLSNYKDLYSEAEIQKIYDKFVESCKNNSDAGKESEDSIIDKKFKKALEDHIGAKIEVELNKESAGKSESEKAYIKQKLIIKERYKSILTKDAIKALYEELEKSYNAKSKELQDNNSKTKADADAIILKQLPEIAQEIIDKYMSEISDNALKNITGNVVSTDKVEGWSDPRNLTVVITAANPSEAIIDPKNLSQSLGRNRGLVHDEIPYGAVIVDGLFTEEQKKILFDSKHINSDQFYPEYFKALSNYRDQYIKNVAKDCVGKIKKELDKSNLSVRVFDEEGFTSEMYQIFIDAMKKFEINNSHNIDETRRDFILFLREVNSELSQSVEVMESPYSSIIVDILAILISIAGYMLLCFFALFDESRKMHMEEQIRILKSQNLSDSDKELISQIDDVYNFTKNLDLPDIVVKFITMSAQMAFTYKDIAINAMNDSKDLNRVMQSLLHSKNGNNFLNKLLYNAIIPLILDYTDMNDEDKKFLENFNYTDLINDCINEFDNIMAAYKASGKEFSIKDIFNLKDDEKGRKLMSELSGSLLSTIIEKVQKPEFSRYKRLGAIIKNNLDGKVTHEQFASSVNNVFDAILDVNKKELQDADKITDAKDIKMMNSLRNFITKNQIFENVGSSIKGLVSQLGDSFTGAKSPTEIFKNIIAKVIEAAGKEILTGDELKDSMDKIYKYFYSGNTDDIQKALIELGQNKILGKIFDGDKELVESFIKLIKDENTALSEKIKANISTKDVAFAAGKEFAVRMFFTKDRKGLTKIEKIRQNFGKLLQPLYGNILGPAMVSQEAKEIATIFESVKFDGIISKMMEKGPYRYKVFDLENSPIPGIKEMDKNLQTKIVDLLIGSVKTSPETLAQKMPNILKRATETKDLNGLLDAIGDEMNVSLTDMVDILEAFFKLSSIKPDQTDEIKKWFDDVKKNPKFNTYAEVLVMLSAFSYPLRLIGKKGPGTLSDFMDNPDKIQNEDLRSFMKNNILDYHEGLGTLGAAAGGKGGVASSDIYTLSKFSSSTRYDVVDFTKMVTVTAKSVDILDGVRGTTEKEKALKARVLRDVIGMNTHIEQNIKTSKSKADDNSLKVRAKNAIKKVSPELVPHFLGDSTRKTAKSFVDDLNMAVNHKVTSFTDKPKDTFGSMDKYTKNRRQQIKSGGREA